MKYVAGILLLGFSLLLGVVAAMNIYFVFATSGKSQFSAVDKPNLLAQGVIATIAIAFLAGAIVILSGPKKKP
jgi:hypothetical protein